MPRFEATRGAIAQILEGTHPRLGRTVPFLDKLLILVTLVAVAFETVPGLARWQVVALFGIEILTVAFFATGYLARLWIARRPLAYALSFWGLVDLLSFLPTILLVGVDLRALRVLRILRLLRLLRLARYAHAAERIAAAFEQVRAELAVFTLIAGMLLYLAAVGIHYFEHEAQPDVFGSIPECLWWAVVTLTTVGYGDATPITAGGRIFTGVVLFVGLGVIAVPTGLIASALTAHRAAAHGPGHPHPHAPHGPLHPHHAGDPPH